MAPETAIINQETRTIYIGTGTALTNDIAVSITNAGWDIVVGEPVDTAGTCSGININADVIFQHIKEREEHHAKVEKCRVEKEDQRSLSNYEFTKGGGGKKGRKRKFMRKHNQY